MDHGTENAPAVLVVEDEPLIRMDVMDTIEDAGFKVYGADCAAAALKAMQTHDDIGVLFTDIEMPGSMDGLELASCIREQWPGVAIMIASGVLKLEEWAMPTDAVFFPKPCSGGNITRTLLQLVGKSGDF